MVRHSQCPHDLLDVRPLRPALTSGDWHDRCRGCLIPVFESLATHARRVEMDPAGGKNHALRSGCRKNAVEFGHPSGRERFQGPAEGFIVALERGQPGRHVLGGGLIEQTSDNAEVVYDLAMIRELVRNNRLL